MNYLTGTFTLNMLQSDLDFNLVRFKRIERKDIPKDIECHISNPDMARVIRNYLGFAFKPRQHDKFILTENDVLYVAFYQGPYILKMHKLPPEGGEVAFWEITVKPDGCKNCAWGDCYHCNLSDWAHGK